MTCHNERLKARNGTPIALDSLDVASVPAHAEEWEKVIAKLRAGLMPPAGMPRPDKTSRRSQLLARDRDRSRIGG